MSKNLFRNRSIFELYHIFPSQGGSEEERHDTTMPGRPLYYQLESAAFERNLLGFEVNVTYFSPDPPHRPTAPLTDSMYRLAHCVYDPGTRGARGRQAAEQQGER